MKKVFKVVGVIFVLLLIAILVLLFFFKSQITDLIKQEANKKLNATLNFNDVGLNLISDFPNLSLSLNDLAIVNKAPFEGDTIFSSSNLGFSIDLMSVISGDKIKINSFNLDDPKIFVYILKDSSANYNIFPEEEITDTVKKSDEQNISIDINSYEIKNGQIAYIDQTSNMVAAIKGLNHSGDGDFSQESFILNIKTSVDELTFEMENVKYLNRVKADLVMDLDVNLKDKKFLLKNNQFKINNLVFNLSGGVELPNDEIFVDLKFDSPTSNFKDILSLIPAIYKNNFADLKASGNAKLNGFVKGSMEENIIPTFNLKLNIGNANFSYPDLPVPVNNVNVDLFIENNDGKINSTIVDLRKIHFELGKDSFDAKLKLTNIKESPFVDAAIKGTINFDNLKKAIQLENVTTLSGIVNADVSFNGNLQTETKDYENLNANGKLILQNFRYKSADLKEEINITNSELNFTPKKVELNSFNAKIGESDLKASGDLNNLISFFLSDGILFGKLNISSNYLNLNPFISDETQTQQANSDTTKIAAVNIPKNIEFILTSNIKNLIYDNLDIKNFQGKLIVKNSKVDMQNLSMNLMNGILSGNGYYFKDESVENPEVKFAMNISNFDINKTYNSFVTVKQFAPIAKYIQGNFSSNLTFTTNLNNELIPDWNTFNSNGKLNLASIEIKNFKPFTTLGNILKLSELSNPNIKNVNPSFKIENGKFYISPVSYKVGNYDITFSGSNSIDQSIDYVMEIDVPASNLRSSANSAISGLLKKDLDLVKSDKIKVKAFIGGTIDSPNIKTSASDIAKNIVSDAVEEIKEKVFEEVKEKVDSLKIKAEQKLKEEAKKKEDELKKKLEEEAKKKLKKLKLW
ncbi:MAG: AsmA family protein [Ignavibacteriae bacterium]|nr:AsmA family protein [Ignavibacteriota bacterium]